MKLNYVIKNATELSQLLESMNAWCYWSLSLHDFYKTFILLTSAIDLDFSIEKL